MEIMSCCESPKMNSALLRPALVLAIALTAGVVNAASAQNTASSSTSPDKARCDQLISYFDYYAVGRSENSDGARNHTRIGAGIDCANGHYAEGVAAMETLLKNKNFGVPPAPTRIAQSPAPLKPHGELRHGSQ
jgi:hypothetical protein